MNEYVKPEFLLINKTRDGWYCNKRQPSLVPRVIDIPITISSTCPLTRHLLLHSKPCPTQLSEGKFPNQDVRTPSKDRPTFTASPILPRLSAFLLYSHSTPTPEDTFQCPNAIHPNRNFFPPVSRTFSASLSGTRALS